MEEALMLDTFKAVKAMNDQELLESYENVQTYVADALKKGTYYSEDQDVFDPNAPIWMTALHYELDARTTELPF